MNGASGEPCGDADLSPIRTDVSYSTGTVRGAREPKLSLVGVRWMDHVEAPHSGAEEVKCIGTDR
jgi:hypothetical protein